MFRRKYKGQDIYDWYGFAQKKIESCKQYREMLSNLSCEHDALEAENAQLIAQLAAVREAAGCSDTACTGKACGGEEGAVPKSHDLATAALDRVLLVGFSYQEVVEEAVTSDKTRNSFVIRGSYIADL